MASNNLTVYRASAGSGKTFTLAVEYIKLLVMNPENYRHILAVTFTNKATGEMKQRILSKLYDINKGNKAGDAYLGALKAKLGSGYTDEKIKQNCGIALKKILHDYSNFNVTTIDTFFQKVMRNMAKELGLPANTGVELESEKVKDEAIDRMIDEMKEGDDVWNVITGFAKELRDEDKKDDVVKEIKSFGKELFSDEYKDLKNELSVDGKWSEPDTDGEWKTYKDTLYGMKRNAMAALKTYGERYEAATKGINEEVWGRGVANMFKRYLSPLANIEKIAEQRTTTTFVNCKDDASKLIAKKHRTDNDLQTVATVLQQILIDCDKDSDYDKNVKTLISTSLTLRHINSYRLLGKIREKVNEIKEEKSISLLSDTQDLLAQMLKEGDASFIYEKIGTSLKYIMIDEFQDTSKTQWNNFEILIDECISLGTALIVGDVKQSIYRWRGGDWRLLGNIDSEKYKGCDIQTLNTNYRSEKNIIDFNNKFFKSAIEVAIGKDMVNAEESDRDMARKAYEDVEQKSNKKEGKGEIVIEIKKKEDGDKDLAEKEITERILYLREKGCEQKDIAVLVRSNKQIKKLADYIEEKSKTDAECAKIQIVSNEAYMLSNSFGAKALIAALAYIEKPYDRATIADLAKIWGEINNEPDIEKKKEIICGKKEDTTELEKLLPEELVKNREKLSMTPAHDLIEKLYRILRLDGTGNEGEYLSKFMDTADKYLQDYTLNIKDLVDDWKSGNLSSKTIENGDADGVRAMTIHKSKGLEFDNVIVSADNLYKKENIKETWCHTDDMPYGEVPALKIDLSKKAGNSIYKKDFDKAVMMEAIDNLNCMYVAFTRAGKNLYILGTEKATKDFIRETLVKAGKIEGKTEAVTEEGKTSGKKKEKDKEEDEDLIYNEGEFCEPEKKTEKEEEGKEENPLEMKEKKMPIKFVSNEPKTEIRQSNDSKDFVGMGNEFMEKGIVMHSIFSKIKTKEDIDKVLEEFESNGIIKGEEKEEFKKELNEKMKGEKQSEWFSGKWELFNECSIVSKDKDGNLETKRPDRVMRSEDKIIVVDFKLAKEKGEYHDQVREYMKLIKDMGYEQEIEGYLWYVAPNKVVEVKA